MTSSAPWNVFRNTVLHMGARVAAAFLGLFSMALATRTLGAAGFGIFEISLVFVGYFLVLVDPGIRTVLLQRLASVPERESEWLRAAYGLRLFLAFLVFPLPWLVGNVLAVPFHALIPLASLGLFLSALDTPGILFQARRRFEWLSFCSVLQAALYLVWACIAARQGWGPRGWIAGQVVAAAMSTLVLTSVARRIQPIRPRWAPRMWGELLAEGWPLGLSLAIFVLSWRIDILLLERLAGSPEAVGHYAFAYRFVEIGVFLCATVQSALLPWLVRAQGEMDRARWDVWVRKWAQGMCAVGGGFAVLFWSVGPWAAATVGGSSFLAAAPLLRTLGCVFPIFFLEATAGTALIAERKARWTVLAHLVGLCVDVSLNLYWIPKHGAQGAAAATVAAQIVEAAFLLLLFRVQRGTTPLDRSLGGVLLSLGGAGLLMLLLPAGLQAWVPLSAYAALLVVSNALPLRDLRDAYFGDSRPPDAASR